MSERERPYAHPQYMKVLKHSKYIQHGCGMQSGVVYSLNEASVTAPWNHLYHWGNQGFWLLTPTNCANMVGCNNVKLTKPTSHDYCKSTAYECSQTPYMFVVVVGTIPRCGYGTSSTEPCYQIVI